MTEVTLAALISGAFGLAGICVQVLTKRMARKLPDPDPELTEAQVLRAGIRRHIVTGKCPSPNDLIDLL